MLKHSRISNYKLKKILKYFVEDFSASEASKRTKLNRNTINRYYNIFRYIIKLLLAELILEHTGSVEYLGYFKGQYGLKKVINLYKYSEKLFLFTIADEPPEVEKYASEHQEFYAGMNFVYSRFSKFFGFSPESYRSQLVESSVRYYYSQEELYELIYQKLKNKKLK